MSTRLINIGGLVASAVLFVGHYLPDDPAPSHACRVPCTVQLGNALEDEWSVDYGWQAKGRAIVDVYRVAP